MTRTTIAVVVGTNEAENGSVIGHEKERDEEGHPVENGNTIEEDPDEAEIEKRHRLDETGNEMAGEIEGNEEEEEVSTERGLETEPEETEEWTEIEIGLDEIATSTSQLAPPPSRPNASMKRRRCEASTTMAATIEPIEHTNEDEAPVAIGNDIKSPLEVEHHLHHPLENENGLGTTRTRTVRRRWTSRTPSKIVHATIQVTVICPTSNRRTMKRTTSTMVDHISHRSIITSPHLPELHPLIF